MQVIVQADYRASLAIATVALNHLASEWKPLAAVRFDKETPLVAVHARLDDLHARNQVGLSNFWHLGVELHFRIVAEHQSQGTG